MTWLLSGSFSRARRSESTAAAIDPFKPSLRYVLIRPVSHLFPALMFLASQPALSSASLGSAIRKCFARPSHARGSPTRPRTHKVAHDGPRCVRLSRRLGLAACSLPPLALASRRPAPPLLVLVGAGWSRPLARPRRSCTRSSTACTTGSSPGPSRPSSGQQSPTRRSPSSARSTGTLSCRTSAPRSSTSSSRRTSSSGLVGRRTLSTGRACVRLSLLDLQAHLILTTSCTCCPQIKYRDLLKMVGVRAGTVADRKRVRPSLSPHKLRRPRLTLPHACRCATSKRGTCTTRSWRASTGSSMSAGAARTRSPPLRDGEMSCAAARASRSSSCSASSTSRRAPCCAFSTARSTRSERACEPVAFLPPSSCVLSFSLHELEVL